MPGYIPVDTPPGTAPLPLGTPVPAKPGGGKPPAAKGPSKPGGKKFTGRSHPVSRKARSGKR